MTLADIRTLEVIIVTNFRDIVVFFPSWALHAKNSFARVWTPTPALALQAVCAASINAVGSFFVNVTRPDRVLDIDQDLVLPMGPPQDPDQPLLSDEEICRTHHRISDFDKATLVRDPARALQFFRWHSYVLSNNHKPVVGPGDTLTADVLDLTGVLGDRRPLYPLDWSDLPLETAAHLKAVQRPCLIEQAGLADVFQGSKSFQLKITGVTLEGNERGFATVYRCQLTSIEDNSLSLSASSDSLCVKLFDDRFLEFHYPGGCEGELEDKPLQRWFDAVTPVEDMALNEFRTYEKLRPVQGTVVPRCYGVYEVRPSAVAKYQV